VGELVGDEVGFDVGIAVGVLVGRSVISSPRTSHSPSRIVGSVAVLKRK